jgi:hypothetical protein
MRRSLRLQPLEFPDCWREQAIALMGLSVMGISPVMWVAMFTCVEWQ